jgi:uncharacterized RDD family membrane protein YckC
VYPTGEPRSFGDQLSIDTPEQIDLRFDTAGLGSRFVAVLLDTIIQAGFYMAASLFFAFLLSSGAAEKLDLLSKWMLALFIGLNFCLIWGYFALFEAFWHGQTPGKRVMKLRVIKDSGRQITLFEALTRNLLRFVDYLPALYLVGVITMLCNKRHQRLGDLAAGTLVVHERHADEPLLVSSSFTQPNFYQATQMPAGAGVLPADAVAKLHGSDLVVIDTFFARALDLSLETRAQIAWRIAAQMAEKMGIPLPQGNPERFLEAIAYALRSSASKI